MEAKEIFSLIGFEPEEGKEPTIDQLREYHNSQFASISDLANRKDLIDPIVSKATGQRLGSIQTKLVSSTKELGLDMNHADFKDKTIEDLIPVVFGGIAEKIKSGQKPDSKLQAELDRIKGEYSSLKESASGYETKMKELSDNFATEKSNWLKEHAENEAWKKINFSPKANDLTKIGFEATIKSAYESMVDENGNIYPVYKTGDKKGSRVANPHKITEHLKWEDLLLSEAKKSDLLADPHNGKPTKPEGSGQQNPNRQPQQPQGQGARRMNPRFAEQANR